MLSNRFYVVRLVWSTGTKAQSINGVPQDHKAVECFWTATKGAATSRYREWSERLAAHYANPMNGPSRLESVELLEVALPRLSLRRKEQVLWAVSSEQPDKNIKVLDMTNYGQSFDPRPKFYV